MTPSRQRKTGSSSDGTGAGGMLVRTESGGALKAAALRKGDKVGIVAPASRAGGPHVVASAERLVREMGFVPVIGDNVLSIRGYMAGSDEQRLSDLNGFIADESIRGIFCITGGYGSLRIIDGIDYERLKNDPKVITGSDENTCLLLAINKATSLVTFHGFNLDAIETKEDLDEFKRAVSSSEPLPPIETIKTFPEDFVFAPRPGSATGTTLGGNLTALFSLMGTPHQPDFANRILFFEDKNERSDVLERWLTALLLSGELANARAIMFGNFDGCGSRGAYSLLSIEDIFTERVSKLQLPTCFNMNVGQVGKCRVIPLGVTASFDSTSGKLELLESALV